MSRYVTVGIALLVGAALGAAAIQTLHAQAKPLAFNIAEITINDAEAYNRDYLPPISKSIQESGGKFIVRGGKTVSVAGSPPAPRIAIIQFENLDKAQAWLNSPAYKAAQPIGEKYATFRVYQVEGVSP